MSREYAALGQDWEVELRQLAREKKLMQELGLNNSEVIPAINKNVVDEEVEMTEE